MTSFVFDVIDGKVEVAKLVCAGTCCRIQRKGHFIVVWLEWDQGFSHLLCALWNVVWLVAALDELL